MIMSKLVKVHKVRMLFVKANDLGMGAMNNAM